MPRLCVFGCSATDQVQCMALSQEESLSCSESQSDAYVDQKEEFKVLANDIPKPHLMVCRVCFSGECKLFQMNRCNVLEQAYQTLTGLTVENDDNLPPYLCVECSQRLLNSIHFRNRSLRSHLMLLETIKKHDHITIESLHATIGDQSLFKSNLSVKHTPIDHYDLEIEHKENDNDEKLKIEKNMQAETIDANNLDSNIMCRVKFEQIDIDEHDYETALGIKIENGILDEERSHDESEKLTRCNVDGRRAP